jgi:hypothetical protein
MRGEKDRGEDGRAGGGAQAVKHSHLFVEQRPEFLHGIADVQAHILGGAAKLRRRFLLRARTFPVETKMQLDNSSVGWLQLGQRAVHMIIAPDFGLLVGNDIMKSAAGFVPMHHFGVERLAGANLRGRSAEASAGQVAFRLNDDRCHGNFSEKKDPASGRSLFQVGDGFLDRESRSREEVPRIFPIRGPDLMADAPHQRNHGPNDFRLGARITGPDAFDQAVKCRRITHHSGLG